MATAKKIRGTDILRLMLEDKRAFKKAVQGTKNLSELVKNLDNLNEERAKRATLYGFARK